MAIDFSLIISLISLGISLLGIVLYVIREKRYRIHNEKIRAKKRTFRDWYQNMKEFTERMEFTEEKKEDYFTVYNYILRKKEGDSIEDATKVKILLDRIKIYAADAHKLCGYDVTENLPRHPLDMKRMGTFMNESIITYPNDLLPKDVEQIRKDLLDKIVNLGKENGLKEKHLK